MSIPTRRTVPLLAVWTLLTLGAAQAQDDPKPGDVPAKTTPVFAFFSSSAEFDLTAKNVKGEPTYLESLSTRLNSENFVFAYVHNSGERDQTVNVVLQAGDDKSRVVLAQTATPIELKGGETRKVALAASKPPAPAAAVVAAAPPGATDKPKEADAEAFKPRGDKLPAGASNLYLRVVPSTAKLVALGGQEGIYNVNKKFPDDFTLKVTATDRTITVELTYKSTAKRLSNTPVKVRLDLRADLNEGLDPASTLDGTFVAELPALDVGEKAVATLVAKNLIYSPKSADAKLAFAVTVDGYDRAFRYETELKGSDPVAIVNKEKAVTNVRLSSKMQVPGKPVTITVEADGVETDKPVELLVNRLDGNAPTEVMRKFPTYRNREVYLLVGDDGAVTMTPVVKDWVVEFPTAQVAGKRAFAVRVAEAKSPSQVLTVDRTPPDGVKFVGLPAKSTLFVGKELALTAEGRDGDSGVAAVYFFTGETPPGLDGKPAAGSRVIPGVEVKDKPATYTTKEPLRLPEAKGELRLGVVFFNNVGLSAVADTTQYVSVPVAAGGGADKPTTGSILGRAVQAGRPQPGLPVGLLDAAGKVLKETKADDTGKFEFKDLAPGQYTVVAVKKIDANATGKATVEVKASKDPTLIPALVIKR